jgi:NAD(P)-dependent dehydrogenase (short-subunit alcohol dehydrogenase family)
LYLLGLDIIFHLTLITTLITISIMTTTNKVWLITGASSGLGQAIAQYALQQGHTVVATFRQAAQAVAFTQGQALGIVAELTNAASLQAAVDATIKEYGRIDVLVNNAGFGMAGAVEETSIQEARAIFETNFFGTLQLTQMVLPILRQQGSGHIIQISSHGGFKAFAGFGLYNASKFALEGISEALAAELAPLGIKLTIVEPGPYRTSFAGNGFALAQRVINDYASTAGVFRERIKGVHGRQEGDPTKAAKAIVDITNMEQAPLRLPLGKIALGTLASKLQSVQADIDAYGHIAAAAVFDN